MDQVKFKYAACYVLDDYNQFERGKVSGEHAHTEDDYVYKKQEL